MTWPTCQLKLPRRAYRSEQAMRHATFSELKQVELSQSFSKNPVELGYAE